MFQKLSAYPSHAQQDADSDTAVCRLPREKEQDFVRLNTKWTGFAEYCVHLFQLRNPSPPQLAAFLAPVFTGSPLASDYRSEFYSLTVSHGLALHLPAFLDLERLFSKLVSSLGSLVFYQVLSSVASSLPSLPSRSLSGLYSPYMCPQKAMFLTMLALRTGISGGHTLIPRLICFAVWYWVCLAALCMGLSQARLLQSQITRSPPTSSCPPPSSVRAHGFSHGPRQKLDPPYP
ncbi:hypothetical protein BaRGS_00037170 [Batillaria attramentaria]|uniref:Uncharacterized protein n=1 Tax=Batillaria attramentaria TaxID=370345 RepID=A0ABD0J9D6_9CAEN